MAEKELLKEEIGAEAGIVLKMDGDDLILGLDYMGKGVGAGVHLRVDGEYFLDKLAEAIPGQIDDMVLSALKVALKA